MVRSDIKIICLCMFVLALGMPAMAQNTKGDKPTPATRDTRFKTPKKSPKKTRTAPRIRRPDDKAGRRAGAPPARTRTRKGERAGRPIRPQFSESQPRQTQKAWKGDITGRRIRPKSSSGRAANVYPQPASTNYSSRDRKRRLRQNDNPNVKRVQRMQRQDHGRPKVGKPIRPTFHKSRPQERQRAWKGDITGRRIRAGTSDRAGVSHTRNIPRTQSGNASRKRRMNAVPGRYGGRARNVFSERSFYVNKQSRRPSPYAGGKKVSMSLDPNKKSPGVRNRKIIPRSASASFMKRRSTNTWAHFRKPKRKMLAHDRDLAGRKLRGKNYETPRPDLSNPTLKYRKRVATGERPYKGQSGGYVSRIKSGRAWKGDITHRRIRAGKLPHSGERAFLGFLKGGGFRSATRAGGKKNGRLLPGRAPGIGANGIANYKGNIRQGSRRGPGNQGEGYTGNLRGRKRFHEQGSAYTGNIKTRRGFNNQGEEYTGNINRRRAFNNQGEEYTGNIRRRRGFNNQGEEYTGNIKRHRGFNNQGEEYTGNIKRHRGFNNQGEEYTGNMKRRRGFNDQGEEYTGNVRPARKGFWEQGEGYAGNIRARRPAKGGGSVSGKLWNNNGQSIPGKDYSAHLKISRYSGNLKAKRPDKGGGSVSGKLWNNDETPLPGKDYSHAQKMSRYAGDLKARRSGKGKEPGYDFSGNARLARGDYRKNPKSADGALKGRQASASAYKADVSTRGVRRNWDYIRNPNSADEAQRTREPGRAFARATNYHGNLKVKRFNLFEKDDRHPDARFVKLNKNNVAEEKDVLTNFKLWWARLFRKSETQPDHLKDKGGKPRYDKGEAGLWYE